MAKREIEVVTKVYRIGCNALEHLGLEKFLDLFVSEDKDFFKYMLTPDDILMVTTKKGIEESLVRALVETFHLEVTPYEEEHGEHST